MNKRHLHLAVALLATLTTSLAQAACAPAVPPLTPSNVSFTGTSGNAPETVTSTLSVDCNNGDSGQVYASQEVFTAAVGGVNGALEARIYADAALTQAIYTTPISVAGTDPLASPNRINRVLYLRLSGPGGGPFTNYGAFSLNAGIELRTGSTQSVTLTVSGTINGACSINNASVDFGAFSNGTKPVQPVGITINCSSGLPWSLSQPSIAHVGPGTGADNNTAWVFKEASATNALYDSPILGSGTGAAQVVSTHVSLHGPTRGSDTAGTGTIAGNIPVLISY